MKMNRLLALMVTLVITVCSFTAAFAETSHVEDERWAGDVKTALNDFMDMYGSESPDYDPSSYVVFDFDNTCSVFDVEEMTAVYQLESMAFAFSPDKMPEVLSTGISDLTLDRTDMGYGKGSYQDWIDDISAAYTGLYEKYGPFTPAGLSEEALPKVHEDPQWLEFAAKMRAMYDLVYDSESASVAYPWVLYWFTGMTEQQVYDLASACMKKYGSVETSKVTWTSPETTETKTGQVSYTWTAGTGVTENIRELMSVLQKNGIHVYICSASLTDTIRAAVDTFGIHDLVDGVLAMTLELDDSGIYTNSYDFENGCSWVTDGELWAKDAPVKAQTQGIGKVTAIDNVLVKKYGHGPIAGFMDSTGDFNFCTEYSTLKLVMCVNRASRKITDGGGLISEIAVYQRDTLGQTLKAANDAGDTFYCLQGRDENGLRSFRSSNSTLVYGAEEEKLFKNDDNVKQLDYIIGSGMTIRQAIDTFAIKTNADDVNNPLGVKYGFLKEYAGYHNK